MKPWLNRCRISFADKSFWYTAIASGLLLIGSLIINYYAGLYATERASNSVTDIILDNTRVYDVDNLFVYGTIIFWVFTSLVLLWQPKRIPFTLKSLALFILIRSVFISLTHLGPYPVQEAINSNFLAHFTFGGDLFFSGHTGLPFLLALIFWRDVYLRYVFILSALSFAAIVLLGHIHYSIDVLSAFFITYTIFHLAELWFKADLKRYLN